MQSDVLPFTMYDSMNYSSVNDFGPPSGFAHRDAPVVQSRQEEPPIQQPQMQMQMQQQQQPQMQPQMQQQQPQMQQQQPQMQQQPQEGNDELIRQIYTKNDEISLGEAPMKIKGPDIGNYAQVSDLLYIGIAVLFVEVVVIFMVRFLPDIFGQSLNRWYDLFSLNAVIADVLIIVLGFVIARYIYTLVIKPKYGKGKWSPLMFTGVTVVTQLLHDLGFYYGVIQQVPQGQNMMMDVFKDYAAAGGAKILFGDSVMMIFSSLIAMLLKSQPTHVVASFGLLITYAIPYILFTKNKYSVLK